MWSFMLQNPLLGYDLQMYSAFQCQQTPYLSPVVQLPPHDLLSSPTAPSTDPVR